MIFKQWAEIALFCLEIRTNWYLKPKFGKEIIFKQSFTTLTTYGIVSGLPCKNSDKLGSNNNSDVFRMEATRGMCTYNTKGCP